MVRRDILTRVLRIVIGIGLAYALIHFTLRSTGGDVWNEISHAQYFFLLIALLFHGAIIGIAICRWNLLLRVQQMRLSAWDLVRLTTTGVFFNLAIPGAVGGDLVKMSLLAQQAKDKKAEAFLTVVLDRVLGVLGLFIVASISVLVSLPFLFSLEEKYRSIQIAAYIVGLGSTAGVLGIALIELRQTLLSCSAIKKIVRYGARKLPKSILKTLNRLIAALELYRKNRGVIFAAIVLSVLIHSCLALNLFLVGKGMGENILGLNDYFLAAPVANAISAIPVTPAGIGTRDAVVALFLSAMKVPLKKSGIVPVVGTLILVFWGLVGGMIFMFSKISKPEARTTRALNLKEPAVLQFANTARKTERK